MGKAFASPTRLELVDLLTQAPRTVDELARESGQSNANTSRHFRRFTPPGWSRAREGTSGHDAVRRLRAAGRARATAGGGLAGMASRKLAREASSSRMNHEENGMRAIDCPCGHRFEAAEDAELFRLCREHVDTDHPEMERSDDQIRERIVADAHDAGTA
jgi:predicted small metal-binding protein